MGSAISKKEVSNFGRALAKANLFSLLLFMSLTMGCQEFQPQRKLFPPESKEKGNQTGGFSTHEGKAKEFEKIRSVTWGYNECPNGGDPQKNWLCEGSDLGKVNYTAAGTEYKVSDEVYEKALMQFKADIPKITKVGFNTLFLQSWWVHYQIEASPKVIYNEKAFSHLRDRLEILRAHGMRAILPLNYFLGAPLIPRGVDYQNFILNESAVNKFSNYVNHFLAQIEDYSDMVYIMVFTENMEPVPMPSLSTFGRQLRNSLGNLPNRIPSSLREKFAIGYHDYSVLMNWDESTSELPFEQSQFDFVSAAAYPYWGMGQNQEGSDYAKMTQSFLSQPESAQFLMRKYVERVVNHFHQAVPNLPLIFGEFGDGNFPKCYSEDSNNSFHSFIVGSQMKELLSLGLGFNVWNWEGSHGIDQNGLPFRCTEGDMSFVKPDGSFREVASVVTTLLSSF